MAFASSLVARFLPHLTCSASRTALSALLIGEELAWDQAHCRYLMGLYFWHLAWEADSPPSQFCLMSLPSRGKVHVATDMAH